MLLPGLGNVGVTCDNYVVPSGFPIPGDLIKVVGHEDSFSCDGDTDCIGHHGRPVIAIAVALYGSCRGYPLQCVQYAFVTYVASVNYTGAATQEFDRSRTK